MRVKLDRSRNEYREYSERNYENRFKRRNYRNDNHSYHSSRTSVKSRPHHHHHKDYSSNRNQSNYYTDHSVTTTRFDRQNTYSEELPPDQPILTEDPSSYYNSSESIRDRGSYYTESAERNRYVPSSYRRESSPPPTYRPSTTLSTHNSYNDVHRTTDYPIRSERYDIPQNRNCSITNLSSPVYRSDSYQTSSSSSSYIPHEQYPPIDYHYHSSSSYRGDRSRLNFNENGSKRSIRR